MKKESIRIGHFQNSEASLASVDLSRALLEKNYDAHIIALEADFNIGNHQIKNALLESRCDIIVAPMHKLPIKKEGWRIGGVSSRIDPAFHLLYTTGQSTELTTATLGYRAIDPRMIKKVLPHCTLTPVDKEYISSLKEGKIDYMLTANINKEELEAEGIIYKRLHPREFIPYPTQGFQAFIIKDDEPFLRKLLHKTTSAENGRIALVERGFQQLIEESNLELIGVHAENDTHGNFLAFVAVADKNGNVLISKLSHATYVGLAEALFKTIQE